MFLELDNVVDEGKDVRLQSRGSKVCPFLPFHPNSENSQRLQEFHLFAVFVTLKLLYTVQYSFAARNDQICLDGAKDTSLTDLIALVIFLGLWMVIRCKSSFYPNQVFQPILPGLD